MVDVAAPAPRPSAPTRPRPVGCPGPVMFCATNSLPRAAGSSSGPSPCSAHTMHVQSMTPRCNLHRPYTSDARRTVQMARAPGGRTPNPTCPLVNPMPSVPSACPPRKAGTPQNPARPHAHLYTRAPGLGSAAFSPCHEVPPPAHTFARWLTSWPRRHVRAPSRTSGRTTGRRAPRAAAARSRR
eukprot:5897274-Prymnesium_polylepis.1